MDTTTGREKLLAFVEWALDSHLRIKEIRYHVERRTLITALEQNGWNQTKTAKQLGLSRNHIARRIDDLKIFLPPISERQGIAT